MSVALTPFVAVMASDPISKLDKRTLANPFM